MKTIIIIGGSKGIGKAIVEALVEDHKIINISRSAPNFTHNNLTHHECDVLTDELPVLQHADGLIYCPGSINLKPFHRFDLNEFRADYEINVIGAVKCLQKYLDALKKSDHPSIVLFSTVAAKLGMPFHTSIATAKSAVEGLVKSIGAEYATTLRINAIAPTVTDTTLASKLLRNDKMKENITDRHPMKKYLQPEDVAQMAKFLLSENSNAISGQVFELDCGIVSFKI